MSVPKYRVANVKVHVKLNKKLDLCDKLLHSARQYSNFCVLKLDSFSVTVFPSRGFLNISGIKGFNQIPLAVRTCNKYFYLSITPASVIVDNSTAYGSLSCKLNLFALAKFHNEAQDSFRIKIRQEHFPAAIVQPVTNQDSLMKTTLLFSNGKFTILGCKNHNKISYNFNLIKTLTDHHVTKN